MANVSTTGKKVNHQDFQVQAAQWDSVRNQNPPSWVHGLDKKKFVGEDAKPESTPAGSNKFAFWNCAEGPDHKWYAQIRSRSIGSSCPFCSPNPAFVDGRKRTWFSVTKTIEGNNEPLSFEWDPLGNKGVLPREVTLKHPHGSSWRCSNSPDHVWSTSPGNRNQGTDCPFCPSDFHDNKRRLSVVTSLESVDLRLELDHDCEQPRLARHVTLGDSVLKFYWRCDSGPDHAWDVDVAHRSGGYKEDNPGTGCPYCSNPSKKTSVTNSLETTHSYLDSEIRAENNVYRRRDLTHGSNLEITWTCESEGHEFVLRVNKRIKRKTPCPDCSRERANPEYNLTTEWAHLVPQLDPIRNPLTFDPETIHPNSETKIWWRCANGPDHNWEESPYVRGKLNVGCPFCPSRNGSTRRASVTNSLEAAQALDAIGYTWTEENQAIPRELPEKSDKRVFVLCDKGHERRTSLYNITGSGKSGCGRCKLNGRSKIEIMIEFELASIFESIDTTVYSGHRSIALVDQGRETINIDILIPQINLIVEYDGNLAHREKSNDARNRFEIDKSNAEMLRSRYNVIRVREGLALTNEEWDVYISHGNATPSNVKRITDTVLKKIIEKSEHLQDLSPSLIEKVELYLTEDKPLRQKEADFAIKEAVGNGAK